MKTLLETILPPRPVTLEWIVSADCAQPPIPASRAVDLPVIIVPLAEGGGASGPAYIHTQAVASDLWIINHNLGYRPDFTLYTVGGVQFFAGIDHPTLNQTRVTLGAALAGEAHGR